MRVQLTAGRGPAEVHAFVEALADWLHARFGGTVQGGRGSAWLTVDGDLRPWQGTHELVAARRGKGQRKRWFAALRVVGEHAVAPFDPELVQWRADRAGGPGGQHVNTTASAVRAVYPPLSLSVRVASERSQHQNLQRALQRLQAQHAALVAQAAEGVAQDGWAAHDALVRGEPVVRWAWKRRGLQLVEGPELR